MQKLEYTSEHIKKVLTFKEHEVLNIIINYPQFSLKSSKNINKFYAGLAKSFISFCEKKLYKKAVENFLQYVGRDAPGAPDSIISELPEFNIFSVEMNFKINNEQESIRIYINIDINGEKKRKVHIWNPNSSELIKPVKVKKKFFRFLTT